MAGTLKIREKKNQFILAKNLYKRLIRYNIEGLNDLSKSMYLHLDMEVVHLDKYVKKKIAELPSEFHDELYEQVIDDYSNYTDNFPSTLGYLLFVRYYSLLEHALYSICQNIEKDCSKGVDQFVNEQKKGSQIERYLIYLKDIPGIAIDTTDAAWLEIKDIINPIRNHITHDDGYLPSEEEVRKVKAEKEKVNKDSTKEEKELKMRAFIASNPSLIILTQFDKIEIKKEFIIRFSKTVDAFFTNIFSAWETWCIKKQEEEKGKVPFPAKGLGSSMDREI